MELKKDVQLRDLMNVGQATLNDLELLNIKDVEQLVASDPDELYTLLEKITGVHQDPCVWDLFAAIIHEARTGQKSAWWKWTLVRKERQSIHPLCLHGSVKKK